MPFLIGTKYDQFVLFSDEEKQAITKQVNFHLYFKFLFTIPFLLNDFLFLSNQARRFAKAMKASLIFCSTSHSINIHKIFKIVLSKAFDIKCTIPEINEVGAPILEYIINT